MSSVLGSACLAGSGPHHGEGEGGSEWYRSPRAMPSSSCFCRVSTQTISFCPVPPSFFFSISTYASACAPPGRLLEAAYWSHRGRGEALTSGTACLACHLASLRVPCAVVAAVEAPVGRQGLVATSRRGQSWRCGTWCV